jgi:hypothetical protein
MSMSVSLHTKLSEKFEVNAYITSHQYAKDYVVIKIDSKGIEFNSRQELTIFPSYEQAKQMHKQLSKLMKKIAKLERENKIEVLANE